MSASPSGNDLETTPVEADAMVAYRLRIELPNRPGALAGVTGEIAASDANITSIDVHEVDGSTAIDEIVVDVSDTWQPSALAAALVGTGAGSLLSSRRMTAMEDPLAAALNAVAAMVSGDPDAVDGECCSALLGLAHGTTARLLTPDAAAREAAGRLAIDRRSTIVSREDEGWTLAALDDPNDPHTVAIVTRPLNVRFSTTEVSRVEALLRVRRCLKSTAAPA